MRKLVTKEQAKIDAFRAIVKFTLVNGQPRGLGKRFREPIGGKEIVEIIFNAFGKGLPARFVTSQSVSLGQSLHDKAGVEVINKAPHSVHCVRP